MQLEDKGMDETVVPLYEQRQWLQVTLSSIGDAVITTDAEGKVTFLNPVAQALTGWNQSEAAGVALEVVFRIINEETRHTVENPATRALREGLVVGLANHTLLIAKDGTEHAIDDSAAPIRNDNGVVVGVVLVFRDVTDRRKAEQALRESEERFRLLVEGVHDYAIFMLDPNGIVPQGRGEVVVSDLPMSGDHSGGHHPALPSDVEARVQGRRLIVTQEQRGEKHGQRQTELVDWCDPRSGAQLQGPEVREPRDAGRQPRESEINQRPPRQRPARAPAGASRREDGVRRCRLGDEPGHPDQVGPRLHRRPLRHARGDAAGRARRAQHAAARSRHGPLRPRDHGGDDAPRSQPRLARQAEERRLRRTRCSC